MFKKELRSLRPFLFVILALLIMDTVDAFLSPFEAVRFSERFSQLADELSMLQILLGFALGSNLLVREIDDGTLNFLDSLPLSRSAIFWAKIQAAMLVLLILPVGLLLLNGALHLATRESLDYALQPLLFLTFLCLSVLVTAASLSAGMLLGFVRYLSWLLLAVFTTCILLLEDSAPALSAALNTADLLTPRFTGTAWRLPWPTIWTQLGLTLAFGACAYILFQSAGQVLVRIQRLHRARRVLLVPVVALMLIGTLAGIIALFERNKREHGGPASKAADAVEFTPIAAGQATTLHYSFSYPALSGARVSPLIASADQTFTQVAARLMIDGGAPIDVDLSGTEPNHDGTAYFNRIRMHVRGAGATATLAHETAHVFAMRLAGGERARQLDGMTVFNEGLAEWVESTFSSQGRVSQRHELAAAIVSARRLVTPRQLTDHEAFASAVDQNLKYPLGAIFVDRFVSRYGPAAPKTLLLTLAKEDFPRDLSGFLLWQTAFQLAGFDLDLVLDDYARYLRQLEPKFAREIAALPRARGSLVEQGKGYAVALRFDLPLPGNAYPVVRFRPGKSGSSSQYLDGFSTLSPEGKASARVPKSMITRGEICFQPGVMYAGIYVYEPWVCLPVSSATPD